VGRFSLGTILFLLAVSALLLAFQQEPGRATDHLVALAPETTSPGRNSCPNQLPDGDPVITDLHVHIVVACHEGYASFFDTNAKVPRVVAYRLTGGHTTGCLARKKLRFNVDLLVAPDLQGNRDDYHGSGYDLGHMAPNQDFSWDANEQKDTFSMINVAPQLPHLNQWEWEAGEEDVRAWAFDRGELQIYVGAILGPEPRQTIGLNTVAVPKAFFKVAVDRRRKEAVAFVMDQAEIPKGDLSPFTVSISAIESAAQIHIPLPASIDPSMVTRPWPADLHAWRQAHATACSR
jgi:endonuclease G